ncbi:hypothetical protein B0T24DRAFT_518837 [Lasiosphaeria ovina]|uniref:Integral membrane protein n=1 Tax=Lasiosphaeria ovina TaxID=92902 RepID=A0AAE0NNB5_9PEZI|nr:hypothetical protein B0T24DRAFT_518837 [Lasiosphaeria ovina]
MCPDDDADGGYAGRWFVAALAGSGSDKLRVCEACFEERVAATGFAGHFRPQQTQHTQQGDDSSPPGCHLRFAFVARALAHTDEHDSGWSAFAAAAARRLGQPTCAGSSTAVAATSRGWRRARRAEIASVTMCEACFLDLAGMTPFADEFDTALIFRATAAATTVVEPPVEQMWTCHAARPPLAVVLGVALSRQDFGVFVTGAAAIMAAPACTEAGLSGGAVTWYTLAGRRCHNFEVCAGCYAGLLEPFGVAGFLQAVSFSGDEAAVARLCDFHPSAPYFAPYVHRLQEAVDVGVWARFSEFVRAHAALAGAPACPRSTPTPDLIWYGYQDCGICPRCYAEVCADTMLAASMPVQGARVTGATMCSMYSPRMRSLYAAACERGSADELVEFAHHRALVHANTLLRADAMRQIQALKMRQAANQGVVSSIYSGGQSFALAAGVTSDYAYGSSTLGWHPTQSGAMAAQAFQNMNAGFAEANSPHVAMEIAQLEAQWLEVE